MLNENNELLGKTEFFSQQHNAHALGSLFDLFVALASVPAGVLHKVIQRKEAKAQGGKVQRIMRTHRIERSEI
jgi:hypothetical protein